MRAMRSTLAPVLLDHATRHGCAADAIAAPLRIPPAHQSMARWTLDAPPIPIDTVVTLAERVARDLDDPELGLQLASEVPRGTYGVQEFAFRNAPTLGQAAARLVRYQHLTNDAIRNFAGADEQGSWIGYRVPGRPEGLGPIIDTFLLAITLRFMRDLASRPIAAREVHFLHVEPCSPLSSLTEYFGSKRLTFGAGQSALIFDASVWELPVAEADPTLLPVLDAYAEKLMPMENSERSWRAQVRDHLRRQLSGGPPTLEECATALGVSVRTLQRRLKEQASVTYRQVVDELREEEARRLMASTDLSIDEVSFLLGFSERRAFARAFTRWTGTTPTRYRASADST